MQSNTKLPPFIFYICRVNDEFTGRRAPFLADPVDRLISVGLLFPSMASNMVGSILSFNKERNGEFFYVAL
jgi:hypothetical protein